jgi:hypothetical protein
MVIKLLNALALRKQIDLAVRERTDVQLEKRIDELGRERRNNVNFEISVGCQCLNSLTARKLESDAVRDSLR